MRTTRVDRVAGAILGLEGLGILGLALWEIIALVTGDTGSIDSSLALLVLTAALGALVLAFAGAVWLGRSWGRSGGIVTQLLILAVALGAATGSYADPAVAVALAVPAVLALVLLFTAARTAASSARRQPQDDSDTRA